MLGTAYMIGLYLLGFAVLWVVILATCCVVWLIGHRRHDWDRAVAKELLASPVDWQLPIRTPGSPTGDGQR